MKRKYYALFLVFVISSLLTGCNHRCSVSGASDSTISAVMIRQSINPNNENFSYINSNRTVEDGIVTITYQYKIEED